MIGTGYVGLVSGACLADLGHHVTCIDRDQGRIARLIRGEVPIFEPGLQSMLARNRDLGRLGFAVDLPSALQGAEVVIIAVGTPSDGVAGAADLSHVLTAAAEVARALTGPAVVVTKSTVPVGTNRRIAAEMRAANPAIAVDVVSNPEFLREGAAIADFMQPDRVIIGAETDRARTVMADLYRPLSGQGVPILFTGLESAELTKYAANAFLATKITFINEIAALCERTGADVTVVARGMGLDPRIGASYLQAGPGFGGSCFPKDNSALLRMAAEHGVHLQVVQSVIAANEDIKRRMVEKIVTTAGGSLAGKTVAVFGVTFKPDTDDMRGAPALTILPALLAAGARVRATDPQGRSEAMALLPGVDWHDDPYQAALAADLVVVLTEWDLFRHLDLRRLAQGMASPAIADLRNLYHPEDLRQAGFARIAGVGRSDEAR